MNIANTKKKLQNKIKRWQKYLVAFSSAWIPSWSWSIGSCVCSAVGCCYFSVDFCSFGVCWLVGLRVCVVGKIGCCYFFCFLLSFYSWLVGWLENLRGPRGPLLLLRWGHHSPHIWSCHTTYDHHMYDHAKGSDENAFDDPDGTTVLMRMRKMAAKWKWPYSYRCCCR